jgi:peptide/nickel transport system permease protein
VKHVPLNLRTRSAVGLIVFWFVVAVFSRQLAPYDPFKVSGPGLEGPSREFLFGTDAIGRDLLSGVVYGARTSAIIVVGVGIIVAIIGTLLGIISGYFGGLVDDAIMRITELFQVIPRFFLIIIAIAYFGAGVDNLILVLGFTSWAMLARVVRAEVLSLRERTFVEAALVSGASPWRVLFREILPNAAPVIVVYLALLLSQVLLLEASLSFIGLGDPNAISWGYLAGASQAYLRIGWWLAVFPGVAILLAVLAINIISDALNERIKTRR